MSGLQAQSKVIRRAGNYVAAKVQEPQLGSNNIKSDQRSRAELISQRMNLSNPAKKKPSVVMPRAFFIQLY